MLDQDFCDYLEYEISKALWNSTNDQKRHFWCDGILLPNDQSEYSPKSINDKRKLSLTANFGIDGQAKYEMILRFGKKSLSRYSRNLDIRECIPNREDDDWITINEQSSLIIVDLE